MCFVGDIANPTGERHESKVQLASRILWGHPIQVMVQQRKIESRGILPRTVFVKPTPGKTVIHVRRATLGDRAGMVIFRKHGFVVRVVQFARARRHAPKPVECATHRVAEF